MTSADISPPTPAYEIAKPAVPLRPWVDHYWSLNAPTLPGEVARYLPGLAVVWVFGRSGGTFEYRGTTQDQPRAFIKGMLHRECLVRAGGPTTNFGVAFRPGAAGMFQRAPLGAFSDDLVDVGASDERHLQTLEARLRDVRSFADAIAVLDAHLLRRLADATQPSLGPKLAREARRLRIQDVRTLVDRSGYSERQLRRVFHREIGTSPKAFVRILRCRTAAMEIRHTDRPLSEIALAHGYYDQAHFVHDFRSLIGLSPGQYRTHHSGIASVFE